MSAFLLCNSAKYYFYNILTNIDFIYIITTNAQRKMKKQLIILALILSTCSIAFGQDRPRPKDQRIRGIMELSIEAIDVDNTLKRPMYPILPSFFEVNDKGDTTRIYNLFVKLPVGGSNSSGQANSEFFKVKKAHWVEAAWVEVSKKGYKPVSPPKDVNNPPKNVGLIVFNWGVIETLPEKGKSIPKISYRNIPDEHF